MIVGTSGYMSPEQVRGERVDPRSDMFCLGTVLYEMLSGRRPFYHPTGVETMNAVLNEEPADFPASSGDAAAPLERIVRHCLEKDPGPSISVSAGCRLRARRRRHSVRTEPHLAGPRFGSASVNGHAPRVAPGGPRRPVSSDPQRLVRAAERW